MDVSDGLAWDLFRLGRSSRVAIDLQHVPIHPDAQRAARSSGRTALDHALHDGEDHELIASVPQSKLRAVLAAAKRADVPLVCMGLAREGAGLTLVLDGVRRPWLPEQGGWKHGA